MPLYNETEVTLQLLYGARHSTAALDLLDAIAAKKGDIVLIVGATGGVGSFAVQLAAQRSLTVIATALPDQEAHVRGLGAADTIDYSAAASLMRSEIDTPTASRQSSTS